MHTVISSSVAKTILPGLAKGPESKVAYVPFFCVRGTVRMSLQTLANLHMENKVV